MSIISKFRELIGMLLTSRAKNEFNITPITSGELDRWIEECANIYQGNPSWLDPDDHIDTIGFAKTICSEVARLTTLGIGVTVDGSIRADWLMEQINALYFRLREWVEYSCAYGTIILKPNGQVVDFYLPGQFEVVHQTSGVIDGVVFQDVEKDGEKKYTKLEYHRFDGDAYIITNRCYLDGKPVPVASTPWADIAEELTIMGLRKPLFSPLKTPHANNIDIGSPVGLPIFSEAVQELRDLDIAYSRNSKEIKDSKRTVLMDDALIQAPGLKAANSQAEIVRRRDSMRLPDYVRNVSGDGRDMFFQEINPTLSTDVRLTGINALLGQIGFKVGFSNGYFVFNEKTGMVTATQVESDDRRTIQFVKDCRDKLETCMDGLVYALDALASLYGLAPNGAYEITYDFGDITYNREEDRARWLGLVAANIVPKWWYLIKFEGMSEEEAKAMVAEATHKTPALFGGE